MILQKISNEDILKEIYNRGLLTEYRYNLLINIVKIKNEFKVIKKTNTDDKDLDLFFILAIKYNLSPDTIKKYIYDWKFELK